MTSAISLRTIRALIAETLAIPISFVARISRVTTPSRLKKYDRLHLGSGGRILNGWANIDITGLRTISWDLRNPLPVDRGHVRLIYSEHFIEHIDRQSAQRLLTQLREAMQDGGVVRISTPDLAKLVADYQAGRVVHMEHGGWFPETACQMLNEGMRFWGHTFVYDEPELRRLLKECGYSEIRRVERGRSDHPELRDLESRPDFGDLIVEARA
jgi:predicted SAM-dependent methyltransferase